MREARGSIFIVLVVFAILLAQSVFARVLAPYPLIPCFGLPFVFALATELGARILRGAVTAFAIGYCYDFFTGNPLGLHVFVFLIGFLSARLVGYLLSFRGVPFEMILSFLLTFALGGLTETIRSFVPGGTTWGGLALATSLLGSSVATALVSPVVFAVARQLDPATERAPT